MIGLTQYSLGCFHMIDIFHEKKIVSNADLLKDLLRADYTGKIKEAFVFAQKKHKGQVRRFDSSPYVFHPLRVANSVLHHGGEQDQIIAALLHDTLEDTQTSYLEIKILFGKKVADLVSELTSNKEEIKAQGKIKYLTKRFNKMSSSALLVKLCDRLDNVSDFNMAPEDFIKKYDYETKQIIKHLNRSLHSSHKILIAKIYSNLVAE